MLQLDSPSSLCGLRNPEYSPVISIASSPILCPETSLTPNGNQTICSSEPRKELVYGAGELQSFNNCAVTSLANDCLEDIFMSPLFQEEADSIKHEQAGIV